MVTIDNFQHFVQEALQERTNLAHKMQDPDLPKKSHLIFTMTLFRRDRNAQTVSNQLTIAELAGSEQGLTTAEHYPQPELEQRQFVTKGLNHLSSFLVRLATGKSLQYNESENVLLKCLRPGLTRTGPVLVINTVCPSVQLWKQTFSSVKGCAKIRERIVKHLMEGRVNPFRETLDT